MLLIASLLLLACAPALQTPKAAPPKTLADYMAAHPWDAGKDGPLVVLEPEKVKAKSGSNDLAAFDRKLVAVGHVHAYVPRTMVLIDDSLSQAPNLYEGLPPDAKMLYLLRSLTDYQFTKLCNSSLGLEDLQGEQRLVFLSLVPNPFSWTSCLIDANGMFGKRQGQGTLTDDERQGVRLKVQRYVNLEVHLAQEPNRSSYLGAAQYRGAPGSVLTERALGRRSPGSAFGLKIRMEVDNQPKRSDLDGISLTRIVTVPTTATVRDLLQLLSSACHLVLIPDFRVADRSVTVAGGSAEAGDLLRGIAEAVTGTYRRVGGVYVLTSDLTGMGYRKLRIAAWENALQNEVWKHEDTWRHEIGARSGFGELSFGGGSMAPSGDLIKTIDRADQTSAIDVTSDNLGPDLQRLLDQWDRDDTETPIRKDKVGVSSDLYYSFTLPDGTQLQPEGSIGGRWEFSERRNAQPPRQPPVAFPIALPKELPLEIAVRAESGSITDLIARCAAHQAKRVWLETNDPSILIEAVDAGAAAHVQVGLLVRPWALRQTPNGPDRTLFGEHGEAVTARIANSPRWTSWFESQLALNSRYPDLLTPTDGAVVLRWQHIEALAKTPGLAGIALTDTEPPGYEPKREGWRSSLGPLEWAMVGHGYSDEQRTEFLRAHAVDPIDLGDDGYDTTAELRQPFFLDDNLQASPSVNDDLPEANPKVRGMLPAWRQYLAAKNKAAILQLATALGRPVFVDARPQMVNTMPSGTTALSVWQPGQPLPFGVAQQTMMFDPGAGGMVLIPCSGDPTSPGGQRCWQLVAWNLDMRSYEKHKPGDVATIFDFTQTPIDQVGAVLDRWFAIPAK